nr:rhomboid family intramembrane serine protease [Kineosphaera limosa]
MSRRPASPNLPTWLHRVVPVFVLVALMWVSEIVDTILPADLDLFGIVPRTLDGLPGIVLSPFLHLGFAHLIANTSVLIVLGALIAWTTKRLWALTIGVILLSGLGVWLLGPQNSITIGASGLVYGYATFLVVYGFVVRRFWAALLGLVVFGVYGSMIWGVLPLQPGVSWQAHLFGALAGIFLAVRLGRRDRVTWQPVI